MACQQRQSLGIPAKHCTPEAVVISSAIAGNQADVDRPSLSPSVGIVDASCLTPTSHVAAVQVEIALNHIEDQACLTTSNTSSIGSNSYISDDNDCDDWSEVSSSPTIAYHASNMWDTATWVPVKGRLPNTVIRGGADPWPYHPVRHSSGSCCTMWPRLAHPTYPPYHQHDSYAYAPYAYTKSRMRSSSSGDIVTPAANASASAAVVNGGYGDGGRLVFVRQQRYGPYVRPLQPPPRFLTPPAETLAAPAPGSNVAAVPVASNTRATIAGPAPTSTAQTAATPAVITPATWVKAAAAPPPPPLPYQLLPTVPAPMCHSYHPPHHLPRPLHPPYSLQPPPPYSLPPSLASSPSALLRPVSPPSHHHLPSSLMLQRSWQLPLPHGQQRPQPQPPYPPYKNCRWYNHHQHQRHQYHQYHYLPASCSGPAQKELASDFGVVRHSFG